MKDEISFEDSICSCCDYEKDLSGEDTWERYRSCYKGKKPDDDNECLFYKYVD